MADMTYYLNQADQSQSQNGPLFSAMAPLVACPPPSRQRRSRTMFTDGDIRRLEEFFVADPYPDIYSREQLAAAIGVPEARIQTWFQNKRSRTRRQINNQRHSPRMTNRSPPSDNQENRSPTGLLPPTSLPPVGLPAPAQPAVFQLAPPPVGRRSPASPANSAGKGSSPRPDLVSPKSERDQNDSGVLDLSVKSNDSPKDFSSPASRQSRAALRPRQASPQQSPRSSCTDADRPFFTPWATTSTTGTTSQGTTRGTTTTPTGAARRAAADALLAASLPPTPTLPQQYPLPAQYSAQNPWLYGFAPSYNHKDGVYYFQPLPSSPFLQQVVGSPGFSPSLTAAMSPAISPLSDMSPSASLAFSGSWSPYLRRDHPTTAFVFPDVPLTATTTSTRGPCTPPADQVAPVVVAPQSSPKADALSDSPGSDAGSRSSGYSSRDCSSPIDVCN